MPDTFLQTHNFENLLEMKVGIVTRAVGMLVYTACDTRANTKYHSTSHVVARLECPHAALTERAQGLYFSLAPLPTGDSLCLGGSPITLPCPGKSAP